jgi:hypothetical protein
MSPSGGAWWATDQECGSFRGTCRDEERGHWRQPRSSPIRLSGLKAGAHAADSHLNSRLGTDGNQNQTRSTEKGAADDAALSHAFLMR